MLEKEKLLLSFVLDSSSIKQLYRKYFPSIEPSFKLKRLDKQYYSNLKNHSELFTILHNGAKVYRVPNSLTLVVQSNGKIYSINFDKNEKENT